MREDTGCSSITGGLALVILWKPWKPKQIGFRALKKAGAEERGQLLGSSYRRRKESWAENKGKTRYQRLLGAAEERQDESPGAAQDVIRGTGAEVGRPAKVWPPRAAHEATRPTALTLSKAELNKQERELYLKDTLQVFSAESGESPQLCLTLGVLITGGGGWERHST